MQNEIRHRLLAKDSTRKSGFRVVGYICYENLNPELDVMVDIPCNEDGRGPIPKTPYHSAREQGIKINGKWYYEGDRVTFTFPAAKKEYGSIVMNEGRFAIE